MKKEKMRLYLAYGALTLATLLTAGAYIQDETFDHTSGPCLFTRLTGTVDHQVKKLTEDGWNVGVGKASSTYITDAIKVVSEDGRISYLAPNGGVLNGKEVIMPNPDAGDTILSLRKYVVTSEQGYSIVTSVNVGNTK